jgi:hypothetical protein
MAESLTRAIQSLVAQKRALTAKEKQLIEHLNRVLPSIGYRVVPLGDGHRKSPEPRPRSEQVHPCPHCSRRFSLQMHLGRHLAAVHGAKKPTAKQAKKR